MYDELVKHLRFCGKCNDAMECDYCEYDNTIEYVDRDCSDRLMLQAADAIEELQDVLLLMVLQYCTTDDGLLYHSFMSAGENAFAALGVENGQQADPLWDRVLNKKPPKEES